VFAGLSADALKFFSELHNRGAWRESKPHHPFFRSLLVLYQKRPQRMPHRREDGSIQSQSVVRMTFAVLLENSAAFGGMVCP
jgi:hypothetical protein